VVNRAREPLRLLLVAPVLVLRVLERLPPLLPLLVAQELELQELAQLVLLPPLPLLLVAPALVLRVLERLPLLLPLLVAPVLVLQELERLPLPLPPLVAQVLAQLVLLPLLPLLLVARALVLQELVLLLPLLPLPVVLVVRTAPLVAPQELASQELDLLELVPQELGLLPRDRPAQLALDSLLQALVRSPSKSMTKTVH
jgi:hypothetical protein